MPIGQGKDYYLGINPAEDRQVKLQDKADEWWDEQAFNYQVDLMESYYPDSKKTVDDMWFGLNGSERIRIWQEESEGRHGVKV